MRDGAAAIDGMSACRKCINTIELVALTGGRDAKSLDVNTHAHCLCLYPSLTLVLASFTISHMIEFPLPNI